MPLTLLNIVFQIDSSFKHGRVSALNCFHNSFGCSDFVLIVIFSHEKVIEEAVLHVDVVWTDNEKTFVVRGISSDKDKNNRKWFLFAEEDQVPSAHSNFEADILKLRMKNFRNICVYKEKLAVYLSSDRKSFEFKGIPLVRDSESSITKTEEKADDFKEAPVKRKSVARSSTPKVEKRVSLKSSDCKTDLHEFLKGHALVKKMKLVPFDPFKEEATEWISKFESEFGKHASVEDLGFNNVLHLIKIDDAKKWHFQYRIKYTDWNGFMSPNFLV